MLPRPRRTSNSWVFGGSSGNEYTDNSRALYEYVLEHRPEINAVWMGHKGCPDRTLAPRGSRWVDLESREAFRLTRAADVVVFSHGVHDVAGLYGNTHGLVVRLGHGLTAFKSTRGRLPFSTARMVRRVDLAPVASPFEREHKRAWGFSEHQLPVTGLPRWDAMLRLRRSSSEEDRRIVLYAPTWRDWLGRDEQSDCEFWRGVEAFAGSEMKSMLRQARLEPAVFAHPIVRTHIVSALNRIGEGVEPISRGVQLPEVLARTALFVTDYSSIAWDALYLGIPTVFFQFDKARYSAERAPFVDLDARLWGPTARDADGLRSAIARFEAAGRHFPEYTDDLEAWSNRAFSFQDGGNCRRVIDAIEESLAAR